MLLSYNQPVYRGRYLQVIDLFLRSLLQTSQGYRIGRHVRTLLSDDNFDCATAHCYALHYYELLEIHVQILFSACIPIHCWAALSVAPRLSVCLSVCPLPSFTPNLRAVETLNLVAIQSCIRVAGRAHLRSKCQRSTSLGTKKNKKSFLRICS